MSESISQNDYLDQGDKIIAATEEVRNKINNTLIKISSADFRLSQIPNDSMWESIKEESTKELQAYQEEENVLKSNLFALKGFIDQDFYNLLLQKYGNVIAKTSNVMHVASNLGYAEDLSKAIRETGNAIEITKKQLDQAIANGDEDEAIILGSELRYYRNDLKRHEWGISYLEKLDTQEENRSRVV